MSLEGQTDAASGGRNEVVRGAKRLAYDLENGFRHIFHVLDFNKKGVVNKSSLQVICANVCRVLDILYMPEHLELFKGDVKHLDDEDFIEYIRQLVRKAQVAGNPIPYDRLEEVSWVVINKLRSPDGRVLSGIDTFLLLRVFNKFDIKGSLVIHRDEAARILESFMKAIGTPWTSGPMDNFSMVDFWTFWMVLECLESKYISSSPRSLYEEGLVAIDEKYLQEIVKCGNLVKKGHKVKSMKDRWFVLQPGKLSYYTTKAMKELKGVIVLNENSILENIQDSKTVKCRFIVTCGEKNVSYEMEASTQRDKNEWMNLIQASIDSKGKSLLYLELEERFAERAEKQKVFEEEEKKRKEQEFLIKEQMKALEKMKIAQEKAKAQAEKEAALLEEERKRREDLEILKEEYERLLEDERKAREEEENVRKQQEKILEEERQKREELEKIKVMKDELLEQERKKRQGLEEESKEQAKILEEERQKLKELDEARKKAEEAIAEAHAKLEAAEEERRKKAEAVERAKNKTRRMKIPAGLARPLSLALQEGFLTHRGAGAFVEEDFQKKEFVEGSEVPDPVNKTMEDGSERAVIVESSLVKPSEKGTFLKDE